MGILSAEISKQIQSQLNYPILISSLPQPCKSLKYFYLSDFIYFTVGDYSIIHMKLLIQPYGSTGESTRIRMMTGI